MCVYAAMPTGSTPTGLAGCGPATVVYLYGGGPNSSFCPEKMEAEACGEPSDETLLEILGAFQQSGHILRAGLCILHLADEGWSVSKQRVKSVIEKLKVARRDKRPKKKRQTEVTPAPPATRHTHAHHHVARAGRTLGRRRELCLQFVVRIGRVGR